MDVATVVSTPVNIASAFTQGEGGNSRIVQNASAVSATPVSLKIIDPAQSESRSAPSQDSLAKGVQQLNDSFLQNGVNLYASYEKDKITGIEVVQLKDKSTHEVIRQIPSKVALAIAQSLDLPSGWLGQLIYDKS